MRGTTVGEDIYMQGPLGCLQEFRATAEIIRTADVGSRVFFGKDWGSRPGVQAFDSRTLESLVIPLYMDTEVNPGAVLQYIDDIATVDEVDLLIRSQGSHAALRARLQAARPGSQRSSLEILCRWPKSTPETFSSCTLSARFPNHVSPTTADWSIRVIADLTPEDGINCNQDPVPAKYRRVLVGIGAVAAAADTIRAFMPAYALQSEAVAA
jgi:hypothetical protein